MTQIYDTIGRGYGSLRLPDSRIARAIHDALGDAASVVNVGAGAGSYEPAGRTKVAVEPSMTMIRQRKPGLAPAVSASGTHLPFATGSFDASLAILTVHHWPDRPRGLRELVRVARRRATLLTWDPTFPGFWLTDYFPSILEIDRGIFPTIEDVREAWGSIDVQAVPIPHDCSDGFLGAYWRRPHAYLDERARSAISTFAKLVDISSGLRRLGNDLQSGVWNEKYSEVVPRAELDLGYRLITTK